MGTPMIAGLLLLLLSGGAAEAARGDVRGSAGPRLGVRVQPMTPELRSYFEVEPGVGVLVSSVEPESSAIVGGIEVGDVLVRAGDRALQDPRDLVRAIASAPGGEPFEIELVRDGASLAVDVILPERRGWERPPMLPEIFGPYFEPETYGPIVRDALRRMREQIRELEKRLHELERRLHRDPHAPERT